jgi:hypothetical protein
MAARKGSKKRRKSSTKNLKSIALKPVTIKKDNNAYRDEIISGSERDYDKLFEQKLSEQYRVFRDLREHKIQIRKLVRAFVVIAIIALFALLLLSFG